ncbi:2384_t:CDS:2 [Dentiscutata heterogama]|uniref:2384_t:CDS:1 n=1 Tax=Dentiscutata heterogama TaxID=1316150 RepID=A0ACA9LCZ8_9GLOM|nr:2384_t:CDS:2 [Dentiscutata heterogama]
MNTTTVIVTKCPDGDAANRCSTMYTITESSASATEDSYGGTYW